MNIDPSRSRYHEDPESRTRGEGYTPQEVRKLRTLLRRLRFLEANASKSSSRPSTSAMWVEAEVAALEWLLFDVADFIYDPDHLPAELEPVSGN